MPREPISYRLPDEDKKYVSREYKIFKEEERIGSLPRTLYEKACRISAKAGIEPDKKTREKLEKDIEFSHLKVTPTGVSSFTMMFAALISLPTLTLILASVLNIFTLIPFGYGMLILLIEMPVVYYLYIYPSHLRKIYEMKTGSEIVTLILYMTMYMRNAPNLERAVRFAAEHLRGPLALEIRKLMWDVETGTYTSIEDALLDYTKKWKNNKEFVEAVEILLMSLKEAGVRRANLLDEAVKVMMNGDYENAKHYNQALRMPVTVVHALGVILPSMGLVMFPIVSMFLGVAALTLFIGYDVLLPMILYFIIINILEKRPATYSKIDISENPGVPPEGMFKAGKRNLPAWPFGLFIMIGMFSFGFILFRSLGPNNVFPPLIMLGSVAFGFAAYYLLLSRQRMALREKIRRIESEFAEALFQLGNRISSGAPIEISLQQSIRKIENLKIKDLFEKALNNIKYMGMTFEDAFFDREEGAIRFYPSQLIKSVMRTVVESSKKGVQTASLAMLSISRYLKNLHKTQEYIQEELSETVSSLKFQLYFLSPLISGVIATLGIVILRILKDLSASTGTMNIGGILDQISKINITAFDFVFVVGVYIIELCFILSIFIDGIENGDDPIGRQSIKGYSLVISFVVFAVCMLATLFVFEPLASVAV